MDNAISLSAQLGIDGDGPVVIHTPVVGGEWFDLTQAEPPDPADDRRPAEFGVDTTDPYHQVDLAWRMYRDGGEQWTEDVLRMECTDPGAARRLKDLAIRDGMEDVGAYFLSPGGRIEFETEPTPARSTSIDLSHPDPVRDLSARIQHGYTLPGGQTMGPAPASAEPEAEPWGLQIMMETAERTAAREAFLAAYDAANPHVRKRAPAPGGRAAYEPTGRQQPAGMTWSDGSPVLDTTGRALHSGELNDVDAEPIYRNDPRLAEARKLIAADRRRRLVD